MQVNVVAVKMISSGLFLVIMDTVTEHAKKKTATAMDVVQADEEMDWPSCRGRRWKRS